MTSATKVIWNKRKTHNEFNEWPLFIDGVNCLKARATSRSLRFTTKFPEISGTHFTDLGRMKG